MMEEQTHETATNSGILEKISYTILGFLAFLLPIFFIPSVAVPFQLSKGLLYALSVVIVFIFYIVFLIRSGKIVFPKNLLFLALLLLPIVYLISAIAGGSSSLSFFGFGFEVGTVSFILLSVVFVFLVSELFQSKERMFYSYLGFFASFSLIALFHIIRFLGGPDAFSFGIFTNTASNLIGNWNDLGIFFGASAVLSLMTLEMLELSKLFKTLLYTVFILSLGFLTVVNFLTIWVVLGVFALIMFVYIISFERFSQSAEFAGDMALTSGGELKGRSMKRRISYTSLALLLVSLLFIISGATLGEKISNTLNIVSVEVRPSWSSTIHVLKESIKTMPLLGSGPNTFSGEWLMHKPIGINESFFWNTDFAYGIGLIPTFFVTTGILGILAWLFFFVILIWTGIRALFSSISDLFSRYLVASSFFLSLFFWLMTILYVPTVAIFILTFFFSGLFAASLYREKLLRRNEISLVHRPKLSFVSIIILVALMCGSATLGYAILQKSSSLVHFQKSVLGFQKDQNLDNAEKEMNKAIALSPYDIYYRGLSELYLVKVDSILARPGATPESVRDEFQKVLGKSIENAKKATELNPKNYQNWVSLARVYGALVPAPFTIPGAYENAKKTYEEALKVNPHSPNILLLMARLETDHGDLKLAREFVNKAITEKQNYAEAHFLLAQIEVTEGSVAKAIPSLETTVLLTPNNPGLFFQLGLLYYSTGDYRNAAMAFIEAIKLVPDYANAKYFLGLSLFRLGDTPNAILQFEDLEKTNPDNAEVKIILANLRAGKDPFANTAPPITNRPEKREQLPIQEN